MHSLLFPTIRRNPVPWAIFGLLAVLAVLALTGQISVPYELFAASVIPAALQEEFTKLSDVAKAAKTAIEEVKSAHKDLDGRVAKIHDELGTGKTDAVTKSAFQSAVERVDKAEKSLDTLNREVTELAQKAANLLKQPDGRKSLGQLASESPAAKSYKGGNVELCTMAGPLFGKAVNSGATSAGALIEAYRVPGILSEPDLPPTVRDLFTAVSISTNAIEWVQEKLFTNNAGPQNGEGTNKPQSDWTFEKKSSAVETIAHWIPVSRQVLADVPQLRGLIDGKLRTGLKIKEDLALLFGDGTNGNLLGLVPQATPYSATRIPAGATKIDHLRWAFLQVAKAQYPATFAVLSLEDWALIQMMKTTDGAYIFGTPTDGAAPRIWGKRVVESFGMDTGDFLAGSSLAATIYDREDVTVRASEHHASFFIQNMVALLCEERLAFTVERPKAIVQGSFPA
jgi:HK97 family phage major capsid protein